jgi:hypothetical protein
LKKKKNEENEDSHLGFKFRVKAPGSVGAVLFLFLKYFIDSNLQSQPDCLVCEGGALHRSYQGCSMFSRDSISRPRPTTMLFYVRHRAEGRKKNQFDLHDDLLFIPLETSFVLALTLDWTTPSTVRAESSAECQTQQQLQHSAQPKRLRERSLIRDGMHSPHNEEGQPRWLQVILLIDRPVYLCFDII